MPAHHDNSSELKVSLGSAASLGAAASVEIHKELPNGKGDQTATLSSFRCLDEPDSMSLRISAKLAQAKSATHS